MGFDETAALLRDLLRDHTHQDDEQEPVAHPGTLEEARQSATEARRSLRGCAADLSAAESAVREASDILVRHANATRYEQVRTPARQQIRELPASALPEHAAAWATAFAPGCASSPTNWHSWSATATASSTACAASSNRPWPRSAPRSASPSCRRASANGRARSSCGSASRSPTRPRSPSASARSSTRRPVRP